MNIHDKAVQKMIESDSHIICEICGGSTKSVSNHICENCATQIRTLLRENRSIALDCIEKQIPVDEYNHNYCSGCGQAIDWSDEE